MKKSFALIVLLSFFGHIKLSSQTLSVNQLVTMSNTVTGTYDNRPTEINGIIDAYIMNGFILNEFKRYTTTATNTSSTYAYFVNNNIVNNEQFTIETDIIPPQGANPERRICSIEFYTSDFTEFQSWFRDLSTNISYTLQLNGHVFHRYQYGFKMIEVGEIANHPAPPPGQVVTEDSKFDPSTVQKFYIFIQYPVAL